MSSNKKGGLSHPELTNNQKGMTSAYLAIQTSVEIILHQPDLKLSALPNLPQHQKTARSHAENWNKEISPLAAKTDADIIDYANQFAAFYDDLVKYAKDIQNPVSKKNLVEGLQLLQSTIQKKLDNVKTVVNDLATFSSNLNADDQNFHKDMNDALTKIEGDHGELVSLGKQLDAIHEAMNNDIIAMGAGAAAAIVGGIMFVVGVVAEIPTAGASTALVFGGAILGLGGAATDIGAGVDYSKQIDKQRKVQEKIQHDKQEMVALRAVNSHLQLFVKSLKLAIKAVDALHGGWGALAADLQVLIEAVQAVGPADTPPEWLIDELTRAKSDWEVALEQAKKLQPDGKISTEVYKNLKDAFKKTESLRSA